MNIIIIIIIIRFFDILWVNIGSATQISISCDSNSVSWWLQNSMKVALAP